LVSAFFVINQIPTSNLLLTYIIIGASSSLATASTELENLRSSYQELETKLKEAELKREQAEKQLAEKNSEHIREKGELELKKNADSETIRRQQKELNGLRKFMETAEQHWDLLNENILGMISEPCQDICSDSFFTLRSNCVLIS
jgi:septal ring factor EnvC (AmiA/AmiB activator)